MQYYMRWTDADIEKLSFSCLLTEVSASGEVLREIGIDANDRVVHRARTRGLFDNQRIAVASLRNDVTSEFFESRWSE